MGDFGESVSEGSSVYENSEGVGEYVLNGIWEGEDGGAFGNKEKMGSSSFHKGLKCFVVISGGRKDDVPKKSTNCFCFATSFFSFLVVFSIYGSKFSVVPVREDLGI